MLNLGAALAMHSKAEVLRERLAEAKSGSSSIKVAADAAAGKPLPDEPSSHMKSPLSGHGRRQRKLSSLQQTAPVSWVLMRVCMASNYSVSQL